MSRTGGLRAVHCEHVPKGKVSDAVLWSKALADVMVWSVRSICPAEPNLLSKAHNRQLVRHLAPRGEAAEGSVRIPRNLFEVARDLTYKVLLAELRLRIGDLPKHFETRQRADAVNKLFTQRLADRELDRKLASREWSDRRDALRESQMIHAGMVLGLGGKAAKKSAQQVDLDEQAADRAYNRLYEASDQRDLAANDLDWLQRRSLWLQLYALDGVVGETN